MVKIGLFNFQIHKESFPKFISSPPPQDTNQSMVTSDGRYDFKHFSVHEADVIRAVLAMVEKKYPSKYQAIGLANESTDIIYKPRYVLFEIIIQQYQHSKKPIDQFAVFYAYQSKGACFRQYAIEYFEKSIPHIKESTLGQFLHFTPLPLYSTVEQLYEREHMWNKAIYYAKKAGQCSGANKLRFDNLVKELKEKKANPPQRRKRKTSKEDELLFASITEAAKLFIK